MQSQPPPKGSLEELFRHHLLESEAAAVPPRPLVWDHIDNSLLLAENEKYRRRLLVHRWGMAASLLLAALAGGGWWHSQQVAAPTLASAQPQREAARRAVAGAVPSGLRATSAAPQTATLASTSASVLASTKRYAGASTTDAGATSQPTTSQAVASQPATSTGSHALRTDYELAASQPKSSRLALAKLTGRGHAANLAAGTLATAATGAGRSARGVHHAAGAGAPNTSSFSPNADAIATTSTSPVTSPRALSAVGRPDLDAGASPSEVAFAENTTGTALADSRLSGEATLAGRFATLAMVPPAGLPTDLALKELAAPVPTLRRNWRYGAEYAISAFQPNIDFNRPAADYNTALGLNTINLTRAAAAEYRANLRPGLGQRLTLRATRWLGGHWSLNTGIEVAQQEAYSATSAAFTGEQLADASSFAVNPVGTIAIPVASAASRDLHESSYRYRSAGVPIELQYDNQAKSGVSFYGRLGAIVSALLSVRSEVAGNPEATRTYSFTSASTPYRRFTALLRGSAGVRYRPASRKWGLNLGPTAEAGVQSLNNETDRSFLQQSRPYSVGIEAGFEFGGGLRVVQ